MTVLARLLKEDGHRHDVMAVPGWVAKQEADAAR